MKSEHNIKAARCLLSSCENFDYVGSGAALTIFWFWRNLLYAVCTSTKDIQSKYENGGSKSTKWKWSKRFSTFYGVNHTLSIWSWLGHFRFATLELLLGFHLPIWAMSQPHFIFIFFKVFKWVFCCCASHSYFVRKLIVLQCCDMSSLCWCLWHVSDPQKFVYGALARFFYIRINVSLLENQFLHIKRKKIPSKLEVAPPPKCGLGDGWWSGYPLDCYDY